MIVATTIGDGLRIDRWIEDARRIGDEIVITMDVDRFALKECTIKNVTLIPYKLKGIAVVGFNTKFKHRTPHCGLSIFVGLKKALEYFVNSDHDKMIFLDSDVFINKDHSMFRRKAEMHEVAKIVIPTVPRDYYEDLTKISDEERPKYLFRYKVYFDSSTNFVCSKTIGKLIYDEISEIQDPGKPPDLFLWDVISKFVKKCPQNKT